MDINQIQAAAALTSQLNLDVQNSNVQQQQQISQLPLNQALLGTVAGNDKNGNVIIKLAGNDLILSSPIALAKNAQVELKVLNVSGSFVAQLLSVDGKLPATQPQKILFQAQQNPQEQGQVSNQLLQNNPQADALALKFISVLPAGAAKVAEPISFPPNTNIIADTVELSSAPTSPLSAIILAPAAEIIQAVRSKLALQDESGVTNSDLEDSLPDEIKAGSNLKVKITSTDSPAQSGQKSVATDNRALGKPDWMTVAEDNPATDLQTKAQSFMPQLKVTNTGKLAINGLVLHSETNGEILLQTAVGKVLVQGGQQYSNVEKGSILNLEISEITTPPDDDSGVGDDASIDGLTKQWPALQALGQHDSVETVEVPVLNKLAGIDDSQFASRLTYFFANAVKAGNIRDWIGASYYDALIESDEGKDIISKLKGDLGTLRENFAAPNPNGWQTMLFPIFDGQQLHQARLHVKYLPDEDNNPTPAVGTRFLVEISTSQFGEMQMDGLVRANSPKHFDLMIRTHEALEMGVKHDIINIFNDASQVTGFKGNLEFGVAREFPNNNILEQTRDHLLSAKINHKAIEA